MPMKTLHRLLSAALVLTIVGSLSLVAPHTADAASISAQSDTMSSVKISALSSHAIRFTSPSGADGAGETIVITFPADFNFTSKTIGTVTFTHGATTGAETTETLAASADGTNWGAAFSGTQNRVLTLTAPTDGTGAGAFSASQKAIITYDSTNSINATSAAAYTIAITGTFGDTGNILVTLLTDDQVAITATVAQSLSFSISDNTIEFGTLTSADDFFADDLGGNATEVEAHTLAVGTNAASGYTTTVKGATLTSGAATITAIGGSNTASSAGTEQFGLRMTATGGAGVVTAPYAAAGFAYAADANTTSQVASSSTSSATTTYSVRYLANISAATEAGAYTAALTYVTTANY